MVTKILASLLFKVGLEHMACVCGKNVSFVLNLRNHFTHVVTAELESYMPGSQAQGPPSKCVYGPDSRSERMFFEADRHLQETKPHTCNSKWKSHSFSQGKRWQAMERIQDRETKSYSLDCLPIFISL